MSNFYICWISGTCWDILNNDTFGLRTHIFITKDLAPNFSSSRKEENLGATLFKIIFQRPKKCYENLGYHYIFWGLKYCKSGFTFIRSTLRLYGYE